MSVTQLSCCADSCQNYKNGYCSLSSIEVSGGGAEDSASTCCASFTKQCGNFSNEAKLESPYSSIKCNAENCIHNSSGCCEANYIDISGHAASECEDTVCSTFRTSNM